MADSPQFYKQKMVGVFERVSEFGPAFRAEPHETVSHLAEYASLNAERGSIADHRDVLVVLGDVQAAIVETIRATVSDAAERDAAERAGARLPNVPEHVPVIHFSNALALVGADPDEPDLAPEHERFLGCRNRWLRVTREEPGRDVGGPPGESHRRRTTPPCRGRGSDPPLVRRRTEAPRGRRREA